MTRNIEWESFCESVVPVILSNSASAHTLAARFQSEFGLSSVLCGERRNILDLFALNCSFLRLSGRDSRLALEQLIDFCDEWRECILVLVPVSEADRAFISHNREALECRFLISENGRVDELPIIRPERWV